MTISLVMPSFPDALSFFMELNACRTSLGRIGRISGSSSVGSASEDDGMAENAKLVILWMPILLGLSLLMC